MNAVFTVEKCPDPVTPPKPDLRKVQHVDYSEDSEENSDEYDDLFNTISIPDKKPQAQVRSSRGQHPQTWIHYIAAEEVTWEYTAHLKPTDR